jgi:hypothetical protein
MNTKRMRAFVAILGALVVAAPGAALAGGNSGVSPDDRPGAHGIGPSPASISPHDRPGPRGTGVTTTPPATIVVHPTGFDWTDAGIGAGAMAGLTLVAAGGLAATATRRRRAVV